MNTEVAVMNDKLTRYSRSEKMQELNSSKKKQLLWRSVTSESNIAWHSQTVTCMSSNVYMLKFTNIKICIKM